ncbi:MAG: hypothetical protein Q4B61_06385 [Bacteroidales bacterium]|nr:hypothetical protein [Bacteroidales bacterium]
MCTIIHHISSYIKGLLFLAVMVLNLGLHQICADVRLIDVKLITDPNNPYKISSAEDFASAFYSYNYWYEDGELEDPNSYDLKILNISLEDNIDMDGVNFVPIHVEPDYFSVTVKIEGNGYTISNLVFSGYDVTECSGLVPKLGSGSIIRNVNFVDVDVTLHSRSCGVLAGVVAGQSEISNCFISGKVSYTMNEAFYLGGVVGQVNNIPGVVLKDITVDMKYDVPSSVESMGGVVGYLNGPSSIELSNIVNKSKDTLVIDNSNEGVGGLFGYIQFPSNFTVHDCSNYMSIESKSPMVGGIVGKYRKHSNFHIVTELYNCTNAGNLYSDYGGVGGIVGNSEYVKISNCINIGEISSYEPSVGQLGKTAGIGGIVGTYNVNNITESGTNTLSSCINLGYVSSFEKGNSAGIVGYYYSDNIDYNAPDYDVARIFPFQNCLSLSSDGSNRIVDEFVFNTTPGYNCIGGLYTDVSLGNSVSNDSVHCLLNSTLTSGKVPFYYYLKDEVGYLLDNESAVSKDLEPVFLQKPGFYPYLPLNDDIAKLASLPIRVFDGERLDSIASGFSCGMIDGVVWSSKNGTFEVSEEGAATILSAGEDIIYGILGDAVISRPIKVYKNVFGGGRGTEENPYLISNLSHLEELRDSLATAEGWSKNKYFKVTANISGLDFALSPTRSTQFMGHFDGDGHTIKMDIVNADADAALFVVAENASIHDLQTSGFVEGNDLAAGVCAVAYNCEIYNCFNSAKISGSIAGGLIGYSDGGKLYGLCNAGTITASTIAGGVIGKATEINSDTRISDLVNSGYVKGYASAGLIGDAERISVSYAFNRLINYGSVCGTYEAYPYIFSSNFSGFSYMDCHYDIQITRNGKCMTDGFNGAAIGVDIIPTTATDVEYELFSEDASAVYVPSFVKKMRNSELLGILTTFENEELSAYVQTSPSLLTSGQIVLRGIDLAEEYHKLSDLKSSTDVPAILAQKSEFGDERETYITIAAIPFSFGDGSEADPYLINGLDDLKSLAEMIEANKVTDKYYVNAKSNNWSYNKYFKLNNDILGDGTALTIVTKAIASEEKPFQGVFDGGCHTIKVSINNQNNNYQALFAKIESGAIIENLIVTGVVSGKMYVSGVVASATAERDGNEPVIRNVVNNVNVTSLSDCVGGICGKSNARIEDCANAGNILITLDSNPYYTGGIVGSTTSNIVRCMNLGTIHGHRRIGGICGGAMNDNSKGLIKDCVNYGMVSSQCPPSADFACVGGIVGSADNFDVETSLNLNSVSCRNEVYVDAIVGSVTGKVDSCYYDKQVSVLPSKNGTGLLTTEISKLSIEGFNNNAGMYPTLNNTLCDDKLAILASSPLMLFESDDKTVFDDVTKMMNYGDVNVANPDIKWTGKNGVVEVVRSEDGFIVKPVVVGTDTLTASYGMYTKQMFVDIYCIPVRLDTTISGCQTVSVRKSDGSEIVCTKDTVFTEVYSRENSICDSTIKYIVKINKLTDYLIDTVLCGKNILSGAVYRGKNYTNTDYITLKDTIGCDSAITAKLRVVIPRVDSVYHNSGCDSVFCEVDGKYYHETVSFYDTVKSSVCDCDSVIIKVNLNVTNSDAYEFDEVYLDSFEIDGKKLKGGESLTIYDTLVTKNGCDSIVKKNIYVYNRVYKMDTVLYACDFYLDNVNFQKITRDTVLVEQLSETLHGITVDGYYLQKRDIHISHNTSADTTRMPEEYYCHKYLLTQNVDGVEHVLGTVTKDTVVYMNIPRDRKCDSVVVRTIHILPEAVKDTVEIVNCGAYYDETLDTTFTSTQDYIVREKYNNSFCDCDSSITLRRYTIRNTEHKNLNISECSEASYTFYGDDKPTIFTSSVDTLEVIHYVSDPDCDSLVNHIHISVAKPIYDTVSRQTCGDTIIYEGKVYLASEGDYIKDTVYRSSKGCDSLIRHYEFRFVETIMDTLPTKYGCDSVICDINNQVYKEFHTLTIPVGKTEQNCDIYNVQTVVVLHDIITKDTVLGCEFAEFNGDIYYRDTMIQLHLMRKLCDCDSTVNVHIVVLPRIESPTIELSDCDSVVVNDPDNGVVVFKEDVDDYQCIYKKVHIIDGNEYFCDSIVHYKIHVKKPTYNSVVITGESSVVYGGETFRRSKVIRDTLVNAEGCDSFVEIKIVVERDLGYPVIVDKFGYTLFCNNNIGNVKFATYQWYKDGVALPGATKEYYEGKKGEKLNGCYYVEVTSTTGREYVSETYCVDKDRELKIYPNPVSPDGVLVIDYPFTDAEKRNLRVEVYDAMGIMVKDFVPTSYPIHLDATLPEGHYFVLIFEGDDRMLDARFIVR